jgi:2-oxo-4-hydroxy-4-carboxy-5-ureidoimidazoline decarboxylase
MAQAPATSNKPASFAALQALDRDGFVAALGDVFEHSPWIAERAWDSAPFASIDSLHRAMVAVVERASPAEQLALLRAHPDLAGREARAGTLTDASTGEQARAGLNALSPAEMRRITALNEAFRARHGIPFIACVGHYTKAGIFFEFERRLHGKPEAAVDDALVQVAAITRLRLDAMFPLDKHD